jgi:hypothetical protein
MTDYKNAHLFMEPETQQYGNHMVMTNVHKPVKSKHVNIDTKFRDDYDYTQPASFNVSIPERLNEVRSIQVTNIEIPMSFYNISANLGNNYLKFTNGSNTEIITLDDNQYNSAALTTELAAKFTASTHGKNITIMVTENGKTDISSSDSISIDFAVDKYGNNDKYNFKYKLGWFIGFRKTSYAVTTGTSVRSECIADLSGPRYLYLAIDEFNKGNQNSFLSPLSSSIINKNIIARIAMDSIKYPYGSILPANKYGLLFSDVRCYTGKVDLQKLHVSLLNETGIPMVLNGNDFSFCFEAICE